MLSGRIDELNREYAAIERSMGDPTVLANAAEYTRLTRRHRELTPLMTLWREYTRQQEQADGARSLLTDPEMAELARAELDGRLARMAALEGEMEVLLLPRDPFDDHDVVLELRAGAGGDEAGLFAADLLRMYTRSFEGRGLKLSIADASESDVGGYSRLVAEVVGEGAYKAMKWEKGVHRVQRIPATETQGRIHTSTVTVAVLPQVEQEDVQLDLAEVRIDVFRAQGAGGQGVNTTDSAVRLTHLPTGIAVASQVTRSQIKNHEIALQILKQRLYDIELKKIEAAEMAARGEQKKIEWGNQIRSYVLDKQYVKDHRTGVMRHDSGNILDGDLDEFMWAGLEWMAGKRSAEELDGDE